MSDFDLSVLKRPDPEAVEQAIARLKQRFGDRLSTAVIVREQHGNSLTWIPNRAPDAVIYAESEEDVVEIVKVAAELKVPVIPYGTGTSLEGHINASVGGITIDVSRMNRIKAIHAEDLDVVVEPGVTRKYLNETLRDTGLFFPIDPGADASIGGMAATRASGTNAVRYGTMKDNVLSMRVVTANGSVVTTASRAKKSSAGYDLTRLFIGSEGTLGIITELTIRLQGIPEAISGGICPFPTVKAAADAVILTIQSGIPVARIELLDTLQVKAVNAYSKLTLPESPLLMLEFHGTEAGVAEQSTRFGEIAAEFGGGPFQWTTKPEERSKLWQARHDVYWSSVAWRPGAKAIATDVCVPISRLADCIEATQADIAEMGLVAPIVGHVGDGNFHLTPMIMMDDAEEVRRVKLLMERLVHRAIEMGGTSTGEHGVGEGKMKYLAEEHGEEGLAIMRQIKHALDPDGIFNPGKVVVV
jgi:D-lactate dehydrogenase (cytochrome)